MIDHVPYIGEKLYLSQHLSDNFVDPVKIPYTVSRILSTDKIEVRRCRLVFHCPVDYYSMPDEIQEDPLGKVMVLRWNEKRGEWCEYPLSEYPYYATFGAWEYYPYFE